MADSKMSDLVIEQRPSRRLWILAGLAALLLHIGCAGLVIAHMQTDDPEDSLGAPAIEIGLEMMAPRQEVTDLPPGPDTDASVASPALAEQQPGARKPICPRRCRPRPRNRIASSPPTTSRSRRRSRRSPQCRPRPRRNRSRPK